MLNIMLCKRAADALQRQDYCVRDNEKAFGFWGGQLAERLGLSYEVTQDAFYALIDNQHPVTGEKLKPRNLA